MNEENRLVFHALTAYEHGYKHGYEDVIDDTIAEMNFELVKRYVEENALKHWGYIKRLLEAHEVESEEIKKAGIYYTVSFVVGYIDSINSELGWGMKSGS